MDIRSKVKSIVKKYKTRNPCELSLGMNVILIRYPLDNGVRGFYQYFKRNNIIYVDERLPEHEQAFVLAHELGHLFLHKKTNAIFMDTRTHFVTRKYELQANEFAINLLISDEFLIENKECTFEQLSRLTGYSEELIKLRIQNSSSAQEH